MVARELMSCTPAAEAEPPAPTPRQPGAPSLSSPHPIMVSSRSPLPLPSPQDAGRITDSPSFLEVLEEVLGLSEGNIYKRIAFLLLTSVIPYQRPLSWTECVSPTNSYVETLITKVTAPGGGACRR